jgi:hypothetical protein
MNQIGTIKRIDQYERVYVPKQILEALGLRNPLKRNTADIVYG